MSVRRRPKMNHWFNRGHLDGTITRQFLGWKLMMTDGLRSLLVVTGTMDFFDHEFWEQFYPIWRTHIFQRGWRKTTNQRWFAKLVLRSLKTPQLQSYQQHQQTGRIGAGAKSMFFFPNPFPHLKHPQTKPWWMLGIWYWRDGLKPGYVKSVVANIYRDSHGRKWCQMTIAHINYGFSPWHETCTQKSCETRNAGESGSYNVLYTFSSRKIHPIQCLAKESKGIWRFPKMGVPQNHGFQY